MTGISKERLAEIAAIRDEDIDFSDIPEQGADAFERGRWSRWSERRAKRRTEAVEAARREDER